MHYFLGGKGGVLYSSLHSSICCAALVQVGKPYDLVCFSRKLIKKHIWAIQTIISSIIHIVENTCSGRRGKGKGGGGLMIKALTY